MAGSVDASARAGSQARFALVAVLLAGLGCVTGPQLRERARVVEEDLAQARKQNALQCAPKDLAVAEANLDFANIELEAGDAFRADEHLKLAQSSAKTALAASKDCGPVQVLIREKAPEQKPVQPKVALKDTDGDGVPDIDDLCPEVPGVKENHGCPLAVDRDGDGVPDDIDRCPDKPGPKENFGCPLDSDGDGIPDKEDKCPNEPGPKENQGCPDRDTDGDGLIDRKDACPNVPGPAENAGCPWADKDGDGVPDKDDKCPDEPGPKENAGCPRRQTLIIVRADRIELKQQIRFANGKSTILSPSFNMLRQVAQALKDAPAVKFRIEGHTDNTGSLETNTKLSQARADAVKLFLVAQGVPDSQLTAQGYGPTRPIASNATKAGKAANRRVEFRKIE
ncbi:MAG: DUF4398 and OmpA-like domain-containing protein [Deltaproteobacteria bacterium]|nr:DUF4398 and OmpA-like domain-containing protein [Deltaproteobacteria bacterium]